MKKGLTKEATALANRKWRGKTEKEKSAYGKMMVEAREKKRKERKLKVISEDKEEKVEINK